MNALTKDRHEYAARCNAVYWRGAPSCGRRGPDRARCVLVPNHAGDWHEGNGYDEFGPKYRCWPSTPRAASETGAHDDGGPR